MTERRLFVSTADWFPDHILVRGEQAHHLKNVLRAQSGEAFDFVDGQGRWAHAMVEAIPTRGEVRCRIQKQTFTPSPGEDRLLLLQALIRFEKFEWILEKATELGTTKIIPLLAAHTEAKWREVSGARFERWKKILIEAMKQCRRLHLPVLTKPARFDQAFSKIKADHKLFLNERPDTPSLISVCRSRQSFERGSPQSPPSSRLALAIGPEGGWTRDEVAFAESLGFVPVSLGEGILRAETAALAALAVARYEFEG